MPNVPNITPDPLLPDYRWNAAAGRYIGSNGQFVPGTLIRNELDKVLDRITENSLLLTDQFRQGLIDGRTWQIQIMQNIKQVHLVSGAMEKGGWAQLSQSDFGRIGFLIKREYSWFNNLIKQLESGEQKLNGTLNNRVRLYMQAGRSTFHVLEREDEAIRGKTEERRILHARDHCPDCIKYAFMGWQPLGTLPVPGEKSVCRANCRCTMEFR